MESVRSTVASRSLLSAIIGALVEACLSLIRGVEDALTRVLLAAIAGYRFLLSPLLPPSCRFVPSCSVYATESLKRYGLIKGVAKTVWRLARCHPFCRGGYDQP